MKNIPALHHHLVPDAPVVFAVVRATIELPVHETRRQGEVQESSIVIDICIFSFMYSGAPGSEKYPVARIEKKGVIDRL